MANTNPLYTVPKLGWGFSSLVWHRVGALRTTQRCVHLAFENACDGPP